MKNNTITWNYILKKIPSCLRASTGLVCNTSWVPTSICHILIYPQPSIDSTAHHSFRADSRFAPSQWEMALLCNDVSHWVGANLEPALLFQLKQVIGFVWPLDIDFWVHHLHHRSDAQGIHYPVDFLHILHMPYWYSAYLKQRSP